ncbi:MAG TPA: TonB C-terminal domain-containing protein [Gemmatimonas sp.]|nr:TonB C-terminal domain-containing protein [Gemmatimonas sp.]
MFVFWAAGAEVERPPVYRVQLVGAPPGPRQAGVVDAADKPVAAAREVSGAERPPSPPKPVATKTNAPVAKPVKATPSTERTREAGSKAATPATKATAAPKAGAGAEGGKGADVANVNIRGIEFPYPGYLSRIVQKLAVAWRPQSKSPVLTAEVKFMIRRDGSVVGMEVVRKSGDFIYDTDAMGAVEAVGSTRGFGPLPAGYADDVLVVYFTFDYALRP